jgi:hypothetical protein
MPADGPKDNVESTNVAWRSVVAVEQRCGVAVESLLENGDNMLWLEVSGREDMTVRLTRAGVAAHEQDDLSS